MNVIDQLRARLAQLSGVVEATSRFGRENRVAWRAGTREIAHLHSTNVIDIRVPTVLQRQWRSDSRFTPRPRRSDWIEYCFRSPDDIELAAALIEMAAKSSRKSISHKPK